MLVEKGFRTQLTWAESSRPCGVSAYFPHSGLHVPQLAPALYFPDGVSVAPTRLRSWRAESVSLLFLDSQAQNKHSVNVH